MTAGAGLPAAIQREWEARLEAEGLGSLDWELGDGCIGVSERGGGRTHGQAERSLSNADAARARAAREEYAQLQRDILEHHRFRRVIDRRVWELHVAGVGTGGKRSPNPIGRRLGITEWQARQSIARTLSEWRARRDRPASEEPIDPAVGAALSEALRGCTSLDEAYERAREIPELADYLGDQ